MVTLGALQGFSLDVNSTDQTWSIQGSGLMVPRAGPHAVCYRNGGSALWYSLGNVTIQGLHGAAAGACPEPLGAVLWHVCACVAAADRPAVAIATCRCWK